MGTYRNQRGCTLRNIIMHFDYRRKLALIGILASVLVSMVVLLVVTYRAEVVDVREKLNGIVVTELDPSTTTTKYDRPTNIHTDFFYEEFTTFEYSTFVEEYETYAAETNIAVDVSAPNVALYNMCDRYFVVNFGSTRLSPLVPLAVANVETPGRADRSITWSALFPSKVVPMELLDTMDVTTVISNESYFNALSSEVSTRDRGALQMSPAYGTSKESFNSMMSGTEKDKLSTVDIGSHSSWASGASSKPGDRFYLPDVLLRLSSAFTSATEDMARNDYIPESDMQLFVMCTMYHHRSGVWTGNAKGGITWNSSDLAYEYSSVISSPEFLDIVTDYCNNHTDVYTIDGKIAMSLVNQVCPNPERYCNSTLVLSYPVKCLYAYIKLAKLYGGL